MSPRRLIRRWLWSRPLLYRPVGRWRGRYPGSFHRVNDFYVLGYPRSANVWVAKYLAATQRGDFRVQSQLHLPALAIDVARRRLPHVLLVRAPRDAALSYAVLIQGRVADQLAFYIDFHRCLLSVLPSLFVVRFEDATGRIRDVVRLARRRFGIRLDLPRNASEAEARARALVQEQAMRPDGTLDHRYYNLPSNERVALAAELEDQFSEPATAVLLAEAERMYRQVLEFAAVLATDPETTTV